MKKWKNEKMKWKNEKRKKWKIKFKKYYDKLLHQINKKGPIGTKPKLQTRKIEKQKWIKKNEMNKK